MGQLCLRTKNLAVELAAMTDSGGAVLSSGDACWLPSSGLSFDHARLAGVHALRAAQRITATLLTCAQTLRPASICSNRQERVVIRAINGVPCTSSLTST